MNAPKKKMEGILLIFLFFKLKWNYIGFLFPQNLEMA